jgi:hypothetical protein
MVATTPAPAEEDEADDVVGDIEDIIGEHASFPALLYERARDCHV